MDPRNRIKAIIDEFVPHTDPMTEFQREHLIDQLTRPLRDAHRQMRELESERDQWKEFCVTVKDQNRELQRKLRFAQCDAKLTESRLTEILRNMKRLESATEFLYWKSPRHWSDDIHICRCDWGDPLLKKPDTWAVRRGGNVLGKDGIWELERSPSSRDDAFYARFRFDTYEEAETAAKLAVEAIADQAIVLRKSLEGDVAGQRVRELEEELEELRKRYAESIEARTR